jgi:hypothetical protein
VDAANAVVSRVASYWLPDETVDGKYVSVKVNHARTAKHPGRVPRPSGVAELATLACEGQCATTRVDNVPFAKRVPSNRFLPARDPTYHTLGSTSSHRCSAGLY